MDSNSCTCLLRDICKVLYCNGNARFLGCFMLLYTNFSLSGIIFLKQTIHYINQDAYNTILMLSRFIVLVEFTMHNLSHVLSYGCLSLLFNFYSSV